MVLITDELMRHAGSGTNPEDQKCMDGYNYFRYGLRMVDQEGVPLEQRTPDYCAARLQALIDEGHCDPEIGELGINFFRGLKIDPDVVNFNDRAIKHNEWKVVVGGETHSTHTTLSLAQDAHAEIVAEYDALSEVIINQQDAVGTIHLVDPHNSDLANDLATYVHNPITGINEQVHTPEEFAQKVAEAEAMYLDNYRHKVRILQKIEDPEEGNKLWLWINRD